MRKATTRNPSTTPEKLQGAFIPRIGTWLKEQYVDECFGRGTWEEGIPGLDGRTYPGDATLVIRIPHMSKRDISFPGPGDDSTPDSQEKSIASVNLEKE